MHALLKKVLDTIDEHHLITRGDSVFAACSGGADSMFLLHALVSLREQLGYSTLTALHLHHGLRGEEADADEQLVRKFCLQQNVPLIVTHADVRAEAIEKCESVEEAGRRLRYSFFEQASSKDQTPKIATAHHADDHAETILMNMFRGCGLHGISGIPLKRDTIIRPLLYCRASEIRAYCQEWGIPFAVDKSNLSDDYTRNRIRHTVMPAVEEIFPSAVSTMTRLSKLAKEDDDCLESMAESALAHAASCFPGVYDATALLTYHDAVIKRALRLAAYRVGVRSLESHHLETALITVKNGGSCNLTNGVIVKRDGKTLSVFAPRCKEISEAVKIVPGLPFVFGTKTYVAEYVSRCEYEKLRNVNKNLFYFSIACDMIKGDVTVRSRCEGDVFRPYKRGCTKTLKKWFNEQKIPSFLRDRYPILSDDNGVLCVLGLAVDERAAVIGSTQQILVIKTLLEKDCE